MFDRPQTGYFSYHKMQVNSGIGQNDFPIPQYVNIFFIKGYQKLSILKQLKYFILQL